MTTTTEKKKKKTQYRFHFFVRSITVFVLCLCSLKSKQRPNEGDQEHGEIIYKVVLDEGETVCEKEESEKGEDNASYEVLKNLHVFFFFSPRDRR